MLATTEAYLGNFESALEISERSEAAAAQAGDLRTQLLSQSLRASVEVYRANYRQALLASERGVSLAREIGARRFEAEALILRGLAARGLGEHALAQESLADSVAITREAARTYCGPWALASLALETGDQARSRALLDEGELWLADGCVSHNYFEFYRHAIEVSLRSGDWDRAERYADALESYTGDERLRWADLVIGVGRMLARTGRSAPNASARTQLGALLAEARRMQFNEIASLIAGRAPP
jgi:ATP/maltotriose-dependent transcriptional regulator MalT